MLRKLLIEAILYFLAFATAAATAPSLLKFGVGPATALNFMVVELSKFTG
jgi:hypothetical protein